jgi:UDP-2-acetamido-2,6-beta-L-arabino-hexul-4-ose reductase
MSPITIGITGQSGFLGSHLYNTLNLYPKEFNLIHFEDSYFEDIEKLSSFVLQCDVVVHLAAVNRHHDPEYIYKTNIDLVRKLIYALDHSGARPHILISSSIQEDIDNLYGRSKKEGRELLANWSDKNGLPFTGFVFPNIFGPFGNPYFNSFIATFSYQLTHNESPKIEIDKTVPLIYVSESVKVIVDSVREKTNIRESRIKNTSERKVTEILKILESFKSSYYKNGVIPELKDQFEINLFNTFRCYINLREVNPVHLNKNVDDRGSFVETIKTNPGGQFSFSTTKPGITRGNHFHTRKIERFIVIKGNARIQLRRIGTDEVLDFYLNGDEPSYVDMPIWYTHNITNIGKEELYTLFWINEFYDPEDPDTYFEKV